MRNTSDGQTGAGGRRESWYDRLTHGAPLAVIVGVVMVLVLLISYQLLPVLKLIAVAMLVALVMRTIAIGLEKIGAPRWTVPIILLAGLGGIAVFIWYILIPRLLKEVHTLISQGPGSLQSLRQLLSGMPFVPNLSQIINQLQGYLSGMVGSLPSMVITLGSVAVSALAILFLSLYMAVRPQPLISGVLRMVPPGEREGFQKFLVILGERLRGWMVGTLLVSLFIGGGGTLGLWILGVPLFLTFGLLAGTLNVVPYVGSTVGALLPALIALTISPTKALLVVGLFILLNQIEGHILQPLIMGREVNLHPALIIISFLVFGTLLGFVGVLLAVPAAVLIVVLVEWFESDTPQQNEEQEQASNEQEEQKQENKEEEPVPGSSRS